MKTFDNEQFLQIFYAGQLFKNDKGWSISPDKVRKGGQTV